MVLGWAFARLVTNDSWRYAAAGGRAYLSVGWTLVSLGAIHVLVTPLFYRELTSAALWFASGGIAMALDGGLNVLSVLYGRVAPGVRAASVGANLATLALSVAFVWRERAALLREPQFILLLSLVLAATAFSLRRQSAAAV